MVYKRRSPVMAERPVPPPAIPRTPARMEEKVRVLPEEVMVVEAVRPLKEFPVVVVAKVTAPVRVAPGMMREEIEVEVAAQAGALVVLFQASTWPPEPAP